MPPPTTFRDVVPILDKLRQLIKGPQIAKKDICFRKEIVEQTELLSSLDIEAVTIETHALGQVGNVLADSVRNLCAEIVARLQTFWSVFYQLDHRKNQSARDDFDEYDIDCLFREISIFQNTFELYRGSLIALNKVEMPSGNTMDDINKELFLWHTDKHREMWLDAKRIFLKKLQKSIEFDEFLNKPAIPVYLQLRNICTTIYSTTERYFGPCEIRLTAKLRDTFIEYIQQPNGSYAGPPIVRKIPGKVVKPSDEDAKQSEEGQATQKDSGAKREWDMELFPMILVSELYEICSDVFDSTETQFHSSLNLHGKHEPIKIRPKQKIKACYLISKLYEIVPAKHKAAWREDILAHLDIQWSYYEKKYCHPRGDDASVSSREYADEIDRIFKNHKKRA